MDPAQLMALIVELLEPVLTGAKTLYWQSARAQIEVTDRELLSVIPNDSTVFTDETTGFTVTGAQIHALFAILFEIKGIFDANDGEKRKLISRVGSPAKFTASEVVPA